MPDELYAQYQQLSHQDLYDRLTTGDPAQVEGLVASWKTIETTISGLAASLRADLDHLVQNWDSAAGWEFHYRVSLIVAYGQMLAEEFASIHNGLSAMSGALGDAKGEAEPPQAVPPPATTAGEAVASAAIGGLGTVVTGVIGNAMGHQPDPAAQRRAHERMVHVVADLASEYRVAEYGTWPPAVPTAPPDMPRRNSAAPVTAPAATVATGGKRGSDRPDVRDHRDGDDRRDDRRGSDGFGVGVTTPVGSSTQTAPAVIGGLSTGMGIAGPVISTTGLATPGSGASLPGDERTDTVGSRGLTGLPGSGQVTSGVIGGIGDTTTGSTTHSNPSHSGGGGGGGSTGHSPTGHSPSGGGPAADGDNRQTAMPPPTTTPTGLAAAGPGTAAAQPIRPDAGIMMTPAGEEHRRWLTSGNMVWRGDDEVSPPAVLGPPEPDEHHDQH